MRRRWGIGNKLFLGFGSMILLSVLTSMVLWDRFQDIASTQQSVIDNAIPAMNESQRLAELSAGIIARAPELVKVRTEQERAAVFASIQAPMQQVDALLSDFDRHGFSPDQVALLETAVGQILDNVTRQNQLVMTRLTHMRRNRQLAAESLQAVRQLSIIAESMVANTSAAATAVLATVYDLIERRVESERIFKVLDRVIEVEFDNLERMFELRLRCSILMDQLQQISTELDPAVLLQVDEGIQSSLTVLRRRIEDIKDPGRYEQANELYAQLVTTTHPHSPDGFRATRNAIIRVLEESNTLSRDNQSQLSTLNEVTGGLVERSQEVIRSATQKAERSVQRARLALLLFGVLTPLLLLALFWAYVRNLVKRIARLQWATHAITAGNYGVARIEDSGHDELSEMARAIRIFKDNAIEKERLDADLKQHKRNLERTVQERTLQLEKANRDLKAVAEQHASARKQAEEASRAKTTFLATMSHEIRTPMNGILGTLRLLKKTNLTDQQRYYAEVINTASRSLLEILNDVLDFSAIETGKVAVARDPFAVLPLLKDVVRLMKPAAEEKRLQLRTCFECDSDLRVWGDAGKLRQVLLNLLNNAIKFTTKGQVKLTVSVLVQQDQKVRLQFEVRDTGIGIAKDMEARVFEPFMQVNPALAPDAGGVGLGLAICQRLTKAMGGLIRASRVPQGGTCMTVTLDFDRAPQDAQATSLLPVPAAQHEYNNLRVLLVEDDAINRMVTCSFLEEFGHDVEAVTDAETALEQLLRNGFDVLLTDISLPGMDGIDLTRAVRELAMTDKARVPIVAISAHVLQQDIEYYQGCGINAFLGKPYEPEKLNEVLQSCVRRKGGGSMSVPSLTSTAPLSSREMLRRDAEIIGFDAVNEMVQLFFDTAAEAVQAIELGVTEQDFETVARQAHQLKSACGSLGLQALYELAEQIDSAARRHDLHIQTLGESLPQVYEQACAMLQRDWQAVQLDRGNA